MNFQKLNQLHSQKKLITDILNSRITDIEALTDTKIIGHSRYPELITLTMNEKLAGKEEEPLYTSNEKSGEESHLF